MSQLFQGEGDSESPKLCESDLLQLAMEEDIVKPVRLLVFEQKYCIAIITVVLSSLGLLLALTVKDTIHECVSVIFHGWKKTTCQEGIAEQAVTLTVVFVMLVVIAAVLRFSSRNPINLRLKRLVEII
jgi:hypothetical protein